MPSITLISISILASVVIAFVRDVYICLGITRLQLFTFLLYEYVVHDPPQQ
jgi:hypothetical protein